MTGAGSGIGRACAKLLAGPDVNIIALDRNRDSARETVALIEKAGFQGSAAECDVTQREAVANAFASLDSVHVLVNSAGVEEEKTLEDITPEDLRRMYEVNVVGLFSVSQAALARRMAGASSISAHAPISGRATMPITSPPKQPWSA